MVFTWKSQEISQMFWIASDSNSLQSNQICPKSSIPPSLSIQGQAALLIATHLSPACYTSHLCWEPILPTILGSPEKSTPRESCQRRGVDAPVLLQRPVAHLSIPLHLADSYLKCYSVPGVTIGRGQLPCDTRLRLRRPILSRCSFQKAPKAHGNIGFHVITMPSWRAT